MAKEIVNRVANSPLKTLDLETFYPEGPRTLLDIGQWLHQGCILREKPFRKALTDHDWGMYKDHYVALTCASEAILPSWTFLLVATYLNPVAKKVVVGDLKALETAVFSEILSQFSVAAYTDKPVIIKGCSRKPIPETAYLQLLKILQPVARSVMFGEACSTVPLVKKKS
ncbi:MAG: DUF2480 family protein [Lutibacter sp.]|jgi:hypothetical protein|nr:DUF2480 family protein [Lutibacter sp.]